MSEKKMRLIYIFSLIWLIIIFLFIFFHRQNINFFSTKKIQWDANTWKPTNNNPNNYITTLSDSLMFPENPFPANKKWILEQYCNVVLKWDLSKGFNNDWFKYNPSKSVFLYHFCWLIDTENKSKFDSNLLKYVKDFDLNNFKSNYNQFENCDSQKNMDWCKLSMFWSKIFWSLLNEFANFKLAALYGYTDPKASVDELIKNFSDNYFWKDICPWKYYLYNEKLEWKTDNFCSHPKTYDMLAQSMKDIQITISNSKFLNPESILKLTSEWWCDPWDILKCGLSNNKNSWADFRNMMYNELMFYNLFISYYSFIISSDPTYQPLQVSSQSSNIFNEINYELLAIRKEIIVSQKAVFQVDKILRNVYATYPTHVWLVAYYEDLNNRRDSLAEVFTPVHQLYYKLRNIMDITSM